MMTDYRKLLQRVRETEQLLTTPYGNYAEQRVWEQMLMNQLAIMKTMIEVLETKQ